MTPDRPADAVTSPPREEALEARARAVLARPETRLARAYARRDDERVLAEQRELTEIAAPPFGEEVRGRRMAELFVRSGMREVHRDDEGNVVARWVPEGADEKRRPRIVAAHLDTVFPLGTDVTVRPDGDRWVGPGISDDGRGLAALLGLARVLVDVGVPLERPVVLAATVGEEGTGDLRGVRHLFRPDGGYRDANAFISLDGAGLNRIVCTGLGSRRFRVEVRGPGGHSWVDWGTVNPIHALGTAVARVTSLALSRDPRASLTVARWGGGTSVNAIPQEAWVELDLRCSDKAVLGRLVLRMRETVERAVAEANAIATVESTLHVSVDEIGHRPAGATDPHDPLVRAAAAATRALGGTPELAVSSTDANVPMHVGVPAITLGAGGEAGAAHTMQEWYRNVRGPDGVVRALLTLQLLDEIERQVSEGRAAD